MSIFNWYSNTSVLRTTCLAAAGAVLLLLSGRAAAQKPLYSILPPDPLRGFVLSGAPGPNLAIVGVEGQSFVEALRLRTPAGPGVNPWDVRIRCRTVAAVRAGDLMVATFWMRTLESTGGAGYTRLVVERGGDPHTKSADHPILAEADWHQFVIPFTMLESHAAGGYDVQFWLTGAPQLIEIGGITLDDYGPGVTLDQLGIPAYEGAEPDASWRAAAAERIDRIRKAGLKVKITDAAGNPVPNAAIHAAMKRHAFGFGSAVAAAGLLGSAADDERYRQAILENFNKAVLENDLKWPGWESNPQRALDGLRWLRDHGITDVRGHNLVWPGSKYMPPDVQTLKGNPEALRDRINAHILQEASAVSGLVTEWDVINEPYSNHDVQDILGTACMAEWFRLARQAGPDAVLYLNDYSILEAGGNDLPHQSHFFDTLRYLDEQGAPVEGIGIQGHFSSYLTPPARMLSILDRFATLGKAIEITEFDVDVKDEQLQAEFTRDFLTVIFSHPAVKGFLMWGFWEGRHWKPACAMLRRDWSEKPNAKAFRDLIFGQWWTDVRGESGAQGEFALRGFQGWYELEVSAGGRSATVQVFLPSEGLETTVGLP